MTLQPLLGERHVEDALPKRLRSVSNFLPRAYRATARRGAFIRRSALQSPALHGWSDKRYEARLARHQHDLPSVSDHQRAVLAELADAGVAVRRIDLPPAVVASADRFVDLLQNQPTDEPCVKATPRQLAADPDLFTWGLSENLLDLAESHIGLPVRYLGVEVKRELVEPAAGRRHDGVRRWHLDHEDRRIFKVIVYLSDVDAGAGPFGYMRPSNTGAILDAIGERSLKGIPDDEMHDLVPATEWKQITGERLTAIHVDTGQVFHRVFPPSHTERYSVTFAYSSRTPYYAYSRLMLPQRAVRLLRDQLSQRQRDALCVGRGLRAR